MKGGDGAFAPWAEMWRVADMIEPNPIKNSHALVPGSNRHKRIISLVGRDDDIHIGWTCF